MFRMLAAITMTASSFASVSLPAAAEVTIFAAASLKEAMDEQAKKFESVARSRVIVAYGGSNALARQMSRKRLSRGPALPDPPRGHGYRENIYMC